MDKDKFAEYELPVTAYTNFDAQSLRDFIINKLSEQEVFTDQIYKGSNLSAFIDIIAYSYHTLIYYLNRTSTESMFSETSIYENINRIVKLLNYSPLGFQTSTLNFEAFASNELVPGTYTLPRYTYLASNDITYSTAEDISFTKSVETGETIQVIGDRYLLFQGEWIEYSPITSTGQDYETVFITPSEKDTKIDHFRMHVYVRNVETGIYQQYNEVPNVYLSGPDDLVFEKRLNENEIYELKFGNNVTGSRPNPGDTIQIYYLQSKGEDGVVGSEFLNDLKLVPYATPVFSSIMENIKPEKTKFITFDNINTLVFTNKFGSTSAQNRESVEDIKRKAPLHLASQDRLVTVDEFSSHIDRYFGNMLTSSKVVDNDTYMDGHMMYLTEDIGIEYPDLESRVMYNHLKMSNTTQFNNVYVYGVPKMQSTASTTVMTNFLTPSQKELMLNNMNSRKMISHEIVIMDPVYVAVNFGLRAANELPSIDVVDDTTLVVKKKERNLRNPEAIKEEIVQYITTYFENVNCELGMVLDISNLGASLLQITGVDSITTKRNSVDVSLPGITFAIWNPVYPVDVVTTNQNYQLPYYKFPYLFDPFNLFKKIEIVE